MTNKNLEELRQEIDAINTQMLELMSRRGEIVQEIGEWKHAHGVKPYDPIREREALNKIVAANNGPFSNKTVEHLFKAIFKASVGLQEEESKKTLLVSRKTKAEDTVVHIGDVAIGDGSQQLIAGPCSVESYEQVYEVAKAMSEKGLKLIRGGAFKPRTSPYDFQGLGLEGLQILKKAADEFGLKVVSEIMSPADVELSLPYVDVIQIGARNMQNFDLLKTVGRVDKPVLLKRGLAATVEEFINAAEYIIAHGNPNIILCERGIRTYEKATRNTLDISAVPILKNETHLPVIVDVTHATGRKDILLPTARAALAIGADAVMVEVHPEPSVALSDSAQQMNIPEFNDFLKNLNGFIHTLEASKETSK